MPGRPARRPMMIKRLRAMGYKGTQDDFLNFIVALHEQMFPQWSTDDLLCHARENLRYCAIVRQEEAFAMIPEPLILAARIYYRKNVERRAAAE